MGTYDIDLAVKLIGNICKDSGITLEQLRREFPNRPTTPDQVNAIAGWVGRQIKAKEDGAKQSMSVNPPRPASPQAPKNWDDISDGNYALPYNGKTHFYRVSRREGRGKWAGRTFVNVQERASDSLYPIDNRKRQAAILHDIREYGVEASHKLFAEVMDQCWHCTKSIGDENNPYKVHGLGPVCGPKVMG